MPTPLSVIAAGSGVLDSADQGLPQHDDRHPPEQRRRCRTPRPRQPATQALDRDRRQSPSSACSFEPGANSHAQWR